MGYPLEVWSKIEVLDKVFLEDKFRFPLMNNRLNVLKKKDISYHNMSLGLVFLRSKGHPLVLGSLSKQPRYAKVLQQGMNLINNYDPDFKCTSIQFNKNYQIVKHIDGRNVGDSYIIALGDYSGGELIVYDENDKPTYIDINHKFYKFNGSKYYHEVADFIGDRISIVFFILSEKNKLLAHQKKK